MPSPSLRDLWSKPVKLGPSVAVTLVVAMIVAGVFYETVRPNPSDAPTHLGIEALVTKVRSELENLEIERQNGRTQPLFDLKDFDLEISFVVKQTGKATGEIKTEVVTVGGETEHSREATQKVTLHMGVISSQQVVVPYAKHIDVPPDAIYIPSD